MQQLVSNGLAKWCNVALHRIGHRQSPHIHKIFLGWYWVGMTLACCSIFVSPLDIVKCNVLSLEFVKCNVLS